MIALLLACAAAPAPQCLDDGDCEGVSVCTEARTCEPVQCLDSSQCPLGAHCEFNQCFTGCGEDRDCVPGHVCDTTIAQCVPAACDDTEIDCGFGRVCDLASGACVVPDGQCASCEALGDGVCEATYGGSCEWMSGGYRCLLPCDPANPVGGPRGFACEDYGWGAEEWRWWGDCSVVAD